MIRIAHFSDIHYAGSTLSEVDRCFSYAVGEAIRHDVACAVISGDSTDHALEVHSPAINALAENVRRLADHCPVLMLQGTFSHDPPGGLSLFRLLGGRYRVHVADRISQVALLGDGSWKESPGWRFEQCPESSQAMFSCVPTVNKAVIAAAVGATEAAAAVADQLSKLLMGFASSNETARLNGIPTIGVSHGTVYGCITEHGVPMAGFDHEFTTGSLFSARTTAFMLGHIHKHQSWQSEGQMIAYPGSIGRLHYGEEGEKGFLLWEVEPTGASFELVPTPAKRTIELTFEGVPCMAELAEQAKGLDVAGAFVRVRWSMPEEDRKSIDRRAIEAIFSEATEVKLEARVIPLARARAAGISQETSVPAKIGAWAQATGVEVRPLLACLADLKVRSPQDIAESISDALCGDASNGYEFDLERVDELGKATCGGYSTSKCT